VHRESNALNEYPYWWANLPAFDEARRRTAGIIEGDVLPIESRAWDVAIVGAGYTGLSAARQLASAGASVIVLDREWVGWGASSRNGGQVLTGFSVDPATLVARYGESGARERFDISIDAIAQLEALIAREAIDCELETSGHLQAAWKPSHFKAFAAEQALLARVFNHRVELVPPSEQSSELASRRYHGLLIDDRSRGLNPSRFVLGLADAARRAGAVIAERTPVGQVTQQGSRWRLTVPLGAINAGHVVIATNGYSDQAAGALRRRLVPIGSYIIATEALDPALARALLPRRRMAFDSKHFLFFFRVTRDHRLLFGGRAEFGKPSVESTRRAAAILQRGMTTVFPDLASVRVEFAWGGMVAFTRDRMPHAGRMDGAYYAVGYSGHGIAMATYLGALVARQLAGESVTHPLVDVTDANFPPIPFYDGRPWFLPAAGLYYRVLDWLQ